MKKNGVHHIKSAPKHPASNREARAFVKVFKSAMKSMKNESGDFHQKLTRFLLSYCTTPHTTTNETPVKLFLGREIRTRLTTLKPDLANSIKKKRSSQVNKYRSIEVVSTVLVRDNRINSDRYSLDKIVHQLDPVTYQVQVGDLFWKRRIDQIKISPNSETTCTENQESNSDLYNSDHNENQTFRYLQKNSVTKEHKPAKSTVPRVVDQSEQSNMSKPDKADHPEHSDIS